MPKHHPTLFFIDTETTGLTANDQIIQFAGIYGVFDGKKLHEEQRINQYINVTAPINFWAQRVHGISKKMVADFHYIDQYIDAFLAPVQQAHRVIGHNIAFDLRMLQQECNRIGKACDLSTVPTFCTMQDARALLDIPGKRRLKLSALYEHLFGDSFANAHDAMADIEATMHCFLELVQRGNISLATSTPGLLAKRPRAKVRRGV